MKRILFTLVGLALVFVGLGLWRVSAALSFLIVGIGAAVIWFANVK